MTDKRIRIILDSSSAKKNADELDRSVRRVGGAADSSAISMNRLAAAIAAVISIQKLREYSDAWTSINNQLRQTVQTQEGLVSITEEMLRVSIETRQSLESTTSLYTRFRLSISEADLSTERLIGVVESINKSLAIGGATAAESAGALRQLSQAIASGVLRGEEFNSIAEQAPEILRAVQVATGKTAGELRTLAADGAITSEVLIKSLEAYADTVDKKFAASIPTIDQAFEVLRTNTINFVGSVNQALGAIEGFSKAIISLGNTIGSAEFISGFIELFDIARLTINSTTDATSQFSEELTLLGDIGSESVGFVGNAFKELLPNVRSLVQVMTVEVLSVFDRVRVSAVALYDIFSSPFDSDNLKAATDKYHEQIELINSVRQDSIQQIFDERQAILSTADAASKARIKEIEDRRKARLEAAPVIEGAPILSIGGSTKKATKKEDEIDLAGAREIAQAQSVTQTLENELALRRQISDIYREQQLSSEESFYNQQLAAIRAKEAEELAILEARAAEDAIRRNDSFRATLENDKLQDDEKKLIKMEQDAQLLLQEQITEEQRTAILEQGKRAREELDKAEMQSRLANAGALGNALMSLGQGQSKKIFKIGQTLALAQAAASLPSAVIQSFQNGGGYPWGLIPAGAMLATGLKNIQQIKSAGAGLGGGGGGSVSMPSLGSATGTSGATIPTTTNTQQVEQRRVYEIRGVAGNDKITVDQFKELMEQDGAVVVLSDSVNDASRRNVVGVTAR